LFAQNRNRKAALKSHYTALLLTQAKSAKVDVCPTDAVLAQRSCKKRAMGRAVPCRIGARRSWAGTL